MDFVVISLALVCAAAILAVAIAFQVERNDIAVDEAIPYGDPFYWL